MTRPNTSRCSASSPAERPTSTRCSPTATARCAATTWSTSCGLNFEKRPHRRSWWSKAVSLPPRFAGGSRAVGGRRTDAREGVEGAESPEDSPSSTRLCLGRPLRAWWGRVASPFAPPVGGCHRSRVRRCRRTGRNAALSDSHGAQVSLGTGSGQAGMSGPRGSARDGWFSGLASPRVIAYPCPRPPASDDGPARRMRSLRS